MPQSPPFAAVVAGLLLLPLTALAQNAIANPDLDGDVTGWTTQSSVTLAWHASDHAGAPGSGSAEVTNASATPSNGLGITQCLPIVPGSMFDLGGWVFVPSGQATSGALQIGINFYSANDCTGPTVSTSTRVTLPTTTTDIWTLLSTLNQIAPGTANSGMFLAFPSKVEAGGTLVGRFDRLFYGPPGTTPVELLTFSVD